MKKKRSVLLSVALALAMLSTLLPGTALAADPPTLVSAMVTSAGHVELTFSKAMAAPPAGNAGFLVAGMFGQNKNVASATLDPADNTKILLTLGITIKGGESGGYPWGKYTPGTVQSADGELLAEIAFFSITNTLPHPTIDATPMPVGTVGTPYTYTFTATGGTGPYTFSLLSGTLPYGLALNDAGVLSGTPNTSGTYGDGPLLRILVRDQNQAIDVRNIVITINSAPGVDEGPAVVTNAVSGLTASSATLSGNVTSDGGAAVTERGFVIGASADPAIGDAGVIQVTAGSGTGAFSYGLTGLAAGTPYCVRAYATNSVGTNYGINVYFTTLPASAPTVATNLPADVTPSGATLSGEVTSDGGAAVTERGFVYGSFANPAIGDADVTKVTAGAGTGTFSYALSGLTPGTVYHVRAYAINSAGTSYGGDVGFTTASSALPAVVTNAVTGITVAGAKLSGAVNSEGSSPVTERGFVYGLSADPAIGGAGVARTAAGAGPGTFTVTLSGLIAGTTYYVRAYAISAAGTAYGTTVSFRTAVPSVDVPQTGGGGYAIWAAVLLCAACMLLRARRRAKEIE